MINVMSPSVVAQKQQSHHLQSFAGGFAALLVTTQKLSCKERYLQRRLEYAHAEYLKLAGRLPDGPDADVDNVSKNIIGDTKLCHSPEYAPKLEDVVNTLKESGCVGDRIVSAIKQGLECYNSIADSLDSNDDLLQPLSNSCSVTANAREQDFTTNGKQGRLRCPFANLNNNNPQNGISNGALDDDDAVKMQNEGTCGNEEDQDPIKAELNDGPFSQAASAASSYGRCAVARCPIRYMNQHSPEEIAGFVEKHKNEIPRSHAVCVQRYQRDSQSMRKLDSKYGGLISMIQGLGEKHQVFLPGQTRSNNKHHGTSNSLSSMGQVREEVDDADSKTSVQRENAAGDKDVGEDDEDREGHFERPLREIRLGESPSRPWGIHVPLNYQPPTSAPQSPTAPSPVPDPVAVEQQTQKPGEQIPAKDPPKPSHPVGHPIGRCPFGHGASQDDKLAPNFEDIRNQEEPVRTANIFEREDAGNPAVPDVKNANANPASSASADIVFNGPVFFGYTPEQTASFLQQLGTLRYQS